MTRRRIKRRKEETSSPALELYELAAGTDYDAESEDLETASDSDLEDPSVPALEALPVIEAPAEASARPARSTTTTLQTLGHGTRRLSTRRVRGSAGSPTRAAEQGEPNALRRRETARKVRSSRNAYYDEFEEV